MANYPSFKQLISSTEEVIDDRSVDRTVGGNAKTRAFFAARKKKFTVRHSLDLTDKAQLDVFYDDYRLFTFTLTWLRDGTSITALFESAPKYDHSDYPRIKAEVAIVEQ